MVISSMAAYYSQKKHRHFKQQNQNELKAFYSEENLSEYLDTAIDSSIEIDSSSNLITYQSEDTYINVSEYDNNIIFQFDSSFDSEYFTRTFPDDNFSGNESFHHLI